MIAIDIDGVVCNSEPWLVKELEEGIGRKLMYTSPRTFQFDAEISDQDLNKFINGALVKYKDEIEPHDYIRTKMALLMIEYEEGEVHFVTARSNGPVKRATKFWIDKYFRGLRYTVHSLGQYANKKEWMYKHGADALVDDRLYTANYVSSPYTSTYLVERDWNKGRNTNSHVIRVRDLHTAVEEYFTCMNTEQKLSESLMEIR